MTRLRNAALGALALVLVVLLGGGRAGAQLAGECGAVPCPTTTTTAEPTPTTSTTAAPSPVAQTADDVAAVFTGPQIGAYPDNRYNYYTGDGAAKLDVPDVPGPLDNLGKAVGAIPSQVDTGVPTDRTASGWVAEIVHNVTQALASILRSLVHWLYSFGLLRAITPVVERIAGVLNAALVGPLRLNEVVMAGVGLALAFRLIFRRRYGRFIADLTIAVVLFIGAGVLITQPAVYFEGVADIASSVAQLPFQLMTPDGGDKGLLSAEEALKEVWTATPWQVENFGHALTGPCVDAGNKILAEGPYPKTDNTPRVIMLKAGCKAEANYNNESNGTRTTIVFLFAVAFLFTAMFIVVMAFGFGRAAFKLGFHFCYGAYSLLFGATPWTHDVAWSWIRRILTDLMQVIVPSWVLAAMLMADMILLNLLDIAVGWRLLLVIMANAGIFVKRHAAVTAVAAKLSGGLSRVTAKSVHADSATVGAGQRNMSAHDLMPGSKLVTVPLAAGAVGLGRQMASGGKTVRKARSVAATAAGPVGAAVKGTKAGAVLTAERATTAGKDASAAAVGVARKTSAAATARTADWRAKRDASKGIGTAPLGDVHGPPKPPPPPPPGLTVSGPPPPAPTPPPPTPGVTKAA